MGRLDIYIPARYHMIRSKTDIVAIAFSLKLQFLESRSTYEVGQYIRYIPQL